tara:strand:- start:928 stop:2109 length:1182 start_codon:yes stop_codon:yes gene_type:complete
MKSRISLEIVIIFFITILVTSYVPTISESISSGGADLGLAPAKCLFNGINHYESFLSSDGRCEVERSHLGEYLQGYYVMLYPLTFLDWDGARIAWVLLNISLIFLIPYFLCKKFEINKISTFFIIFFCYYCIITRVNLIMGQITLVMLFFLTLPFIFKSKISYILSGITYFKYNIGYALFFLYITSKKYKILTLSLLPSFIGWVLYSLITSTNLVTNFFEPFLLMVNNMGANAALKSIHIFSFINEFGIINSKYQTVITLIPSIIVNIFFITKINKIQDNLLKLSCLNISILIFLPHYGHDYIILIPLLVHAIKNYDNNLFLSRINLLTVIYFLQLYSGIQKYLNKIFIYLDLSFSFISFVNSAYPYFHILILLLVLMLNLQKSDQIIKHEAN